MRQIDMAIDKTIYNNGIKGNLSYWEIDSLPRDYAIYKQMFRDATKRKEKEQLERNSYKGLKIDNEAMMKNARINEFTYPRRMSKLEEEKRIMQVLTRASYGMSREKEFLKCEDYGVMTNWQKFKMKLKFIFNIKRWWNLLMLKHALKKNWSAYRKKYKEASKEFKAMRKEMAKKYGTTDLSYDMVSDKWKPRPGCGT